MTDEIKKPAEHGDYERSDISASAVVYFLVGLAVFLLITHFAVTGIYHYLDKQAEAQQAPVNPLVTNAPTDTRHLPEKYRGGKGYEEYLKDSFPAPQLETDERRQLDDIRTKEEQTLSTYDYIDQKAGTVRIPIDRAMDLIAQHGLPTRSQTSTDNGATEQATKQKGTGEKGNKK